MTDGKQTVLCLGGGTESLSIIEYIYNAGYRPVVFDFNPECAGAKWVAERAREWKEANRKYSQRLGWMLKDPDRRTNRLPKPDEYPPAVFLQTDCYSEQSTELMIRYALAPAKFSMPKKQTYFENVVGVICCAVDAPVVQASIARRFRAPTIGRDAARLGANKYWQYERLRDAGIPVPDTKIVNPQMSWDEVSDYDIVKPVDSRGARGVRFYTQKDYREAFAESLGYSLSHRSIITQKFIEGMQISTESVIWGSEVIMTAMAQRNYDRLDDFAPYIIEDGSDSPLEVVNTQVRRDIIGVIGQACHALGWNNCTVKGDIIVHPSGAVYIIELAPRLSGGYFASHIIPLAYGWDVLGDAVAMAVGKPPELKLARDLSYVCQRFVFQKPEWIGKRLSYIPDTENYPGVELLRWNYKVGDVVRPVRAHPDRLGMVLVIGGAKEGTRSAAENIVARLLDEIRVE